MHTISTEPVDKIVGNRSSAIARDLTLNLKRVLEQGALAPAEALYTLLATATSLGDAELAAYAREQLQALDASEAQVQEAAECAAIMGMLNTYYRFRHMVARDDDYKAAGLRMTSLAKPVLGKEIFEMLALAVSVLNGCESCIRAHEQQLREGGVSVDKIHDIVRLAAIAKGLQALRAG